MTTLMRTIETVDPKTRQTCARKLRGNSRAAAPLARDVVIPTLPKLVVE
jgi:hypothetical protein